MLDAVADDGFRRVGASATELMTPNGEYSKRLHAAASPVSAVVVRSSTPGVLSSAALFLRNLSLLPIPVSLALSAGRQ